jgi:hypothetical protein
MVCALCAGDAGSNLLANPGFEEISGEKPARWELFVAPLEGASGRLDNAAFAGRYSVMLHTPTPYAKDPANNWSQNVIGEFGGKAMHVGGYVKTTEATEAAIWLQCWRKKPWGVTASISTSANAPMYGNRDWEYVEATLDVPGDTDFLTVRCVLKGTGTAWFDDIELDSKDSEKKAEKPAKPSVEQKPTPTPPPPRAKAPEAEPEESPFPLTKMAPPGQESPKSTYAPASDLARMDLLEAEVKQLRTANDTLAETLKQVRQANAELLEQTAMLRSEVSSLQPQAERENTPAPGAPKMGQAPPLVPHGVDWRTLR